MLDPNSIGHTLFNTQPFTPDPLQDQMRVLQARQGMAQMQTQQRLRDLASQSDLSTPEGVQAFTGAYGRLDPVGAIGLGQKYNQGQQEAEGAKKNAALADLNLKRAKHLMTSELAQENFGILNGTLQQIQKLPPGDPQRKILAHQAYLATVKNSTDYGNPPPPPDDEGPDPEAWLVNKTAQAAPLAMQIAAQKAALHGDEALSPIAKAKADMKAGRITQDEYNAILRKETTVQPNMATIMMGGASSLTPETKDMLVDKYLKTGQLDADISARNPGLRNEILNAAAAKLKASGSTPDLAGAKASYKSDQSSLSNIQKQRDQVVAFESTALKNLGVFEGLAKDLVDTGSPLLNKPIRYLAAQAAGSPGQAAANAALQTVIPEFAKINSGQMGQGALSDSSRHEIANILPESATLGQILAIGKVLRQDASNRHQSLDQQLSEIKGRISGKGAAPVATARPTATGSNGEKYILSDDGKSWEPVK